MANSNLIANLNSIYATKLEIKEVLNTESDDFTEYPDLIEAAIASGGASGYAYITENGNHDIATYAYVNVNVPQQEVPVVPPGYAYVYGTKEILENGTVDISSYASAYVNVPAPEGWILPSGYAFITNNGNFDIREFEYVNVDVTGEVPPGYTYVYGSYDIAANGDGIDISSYATVNVNVPVPSGYIIPAGVAEITENGHGFDVRQYAYAYVDVPASAVVSGTLNIDSVGTHDVTTYAYAYVDIVVPTYVFGYHNITSNGTTYASTYGFDGFSYVTVNVPTGGGSNIMNISGQYGSYNGRYFVYDSNNSSYLTFTGPISNINLGDTVTGTAEYADAGNGTLSTYLFKNFTGTSVQDADREYTYFKVGSVSTMLQPLVTSISDKIQCTTYHYHDNEGMSTYILGNDYNGTSIHYDSTVYCYVSTGYPMGATRYWINEVVSVVNPVLTGVSYSLDQGYTWNTMSFDSSTNTYSVTSLHENIGAAQTGTYHIQCEYDNGASYKYITNYIQIQNDDTSPVSAEMLQDEMDMGMMIENVSAERLLEINGISISDTTITISFT